MENNEYKDVLSVPYVVWRDTVSSKRRAVSLWATVAIIAIVLLFVSNLAWLLVWNQYDITTETIETTVDSEGDGIANYTGGDGGVMIGEGEYPQDEGNTD